MRGKRQRGELIILEGPDGVGKTTTSRVLSEFLASQGTDLEVISFPGRDPGSLGELVYRIHHEDQELVRPLSPLSLQALHVAAHVDMIEGRIIPALHRGSSVILDRYWWSTWVYGIVAGCEPAKLRPFIEAENAVWGLIKPSIVILLERDRPINRNVTLDSWKPLAQEYEKLALDQENSHPILRLSNLKSPQAAVEALVEFKRRQDDDGLNILRRARRDKSASRGGLTYLPSRPRLLTTPVYDTFWLFASRRQEIFFSRVDGHPAPWCEDKILSEFKFTNAYRASDRTSQFLIRNVLYRDDLPKTPEEVFFRCMLFKLFNKIETWEALEARFGPVSLDTFTVESYGLALTNLTKSGQAIYSAAYIMPEGLVNSASRGKHFGHLALLWQMLKDEVPKILCDCTRMQDAFELLRSYRGIGDFLAYQYATDINYSQITNFPEMQFVVPGPGCIDGIRKCFTSQGDVSDIELIRMVADRQESEFNRLNLNFRNLWGRPLMLIDIQNLFCEVDKYSRVRHPEYSGASGRTRIKQKLRPRPGLPEPWYPPKWGINEAIAKTNKKPKLD